MTDQRPYTMAGLAESLAISRQALIDYAERKEFLDSVGAAKEKVHRFTEEQLFGRASSGAAFGLLNNWDGRTSRKSTRLRTVATSILSLHLLSLSCESLHRRTRSGSPRGCQA